VKRFALLLCLAGLFCNASAVAANWAVRALPAKLVNGSPVLFRVRPPRHLESLKGAWLGHEVPFSYDAASKSWFALAGVGFETAPGTYSLELTGERVDGAADSKMTFSRKFAVGRGKYPKIKVELSVESKFTEPTPEQQKQIAEGQEIK
jgi:hypothetical protein